MKIVYDTMSFDSQLELDYYKYITSDTSVMELYYHLKKPIKFTNMKRTYTPDFVVVYEDRIEIVETKGYNQFSFRIDNEIHLRMKNLTEEELKQYLLDNNIFVGNKRVIYKKIKYLKAYGFVDFDFKNQNTLIKKTRAKRDELQEELKQAKTIIKEYERYLNYTLAENYLNKKLSKLQLEWKKKFIENYLKERMYENKK